MVDGFGSEREGSLLSSGYGFKAVFFNLGSAEPRGSAKIYLGSAKYLKKLFITLPLFTGHIFKEKN
jgi:hypothetical protein